MIASCMHLRRRQSTIYTVWELHQTKICNPLAVLSQRAHVAAAFRLEATAFAAPVLRDGLAFEDGFEATAGGLPRLGFTRETRTARAAFFTMAI